MVKSAVAKGPDLKMDCNDEELSPSQLEDYQRKLSLYEAAEKEIENLKKIAVGDITQLNEYSMHFRTVVMVSTVGLTSGQTLQGPGLQVLDADAGIPLTVPAAPITAAPIRVPKIINVSRAASKPQSTPPPAQPVAPVVMPTPPALAKKAAPASKIISPASRQQKVQPRILKDQVTTPKTQALARPPVSAPSRIAPRPTPAPAPAPVTPVARKDDDDDIEIIGTKKVAATTPAGKQPAAAAKDESKLFPSLSVVARAVHVDSPSVAQKKRQELDGIVKNKLILSTAQFAEWLMQEGIVRSSQVCPLHCSPDLQPIQLKLGKATDDTKFPHSGGYVWIGECCPASFVSIFNGSIFGGSPHPPSTLLKLIYHWSCHTPVSNVIQWVKIDRHYLKSFYTLMRSVCTYAVQTGIKQCGAGGGTVEVGVISLGTTSSDGKKREVRVEVLGVLDQSTNRMRLRAIEPVAGSKNRFVKILEPLRQWVYPGAKIVTDYTVDRTTLVSLGFTRVIQKNPAATAPTDTSTNAVCMDYLRKNVPKVFQNTLSLLSTNMIQQFLDELTWREIWGPNSLDAFQNILKDIRGLTIAETTDPILSRLAKVAANPFGNWSQVLNKPSQPQPKRTIFYNGKALIPPASAPKQAPANRKRLASFKPPESPTQAKKLKDDDDTNVTYFGRCAGKKVDIPTTSGYCFHCPISGCPKTFSDNLLFGKHLFSHVDNRMQLSELSDHVQCKYCFKVFATPYAMQSHMSSTHLENTKKIMCMICEEEFKEASHLLSHLREKHSALEMPYVCELCDYKTSSHRDIVDHFHQDHSGTPFVMCHLCLKTFNVMGERNQDRQNFIYHMKEHQKTTVGRKYSCTKCALVFLTSAKYNQHLKQHNTTVSSGVTPFSSADYPVLDELAKMTSKKLGDGILLVKSYPELTFGYLDETLLCFECKEPLLNEKHFSSYLCCANCRYATCCTKAMTNHRQTAHSAAPTSTEAPELVFSLGQTMHCVCGFMTSSGNALGKHLIKCGKNKCYPSKEAAESALQMEKSASFPPLVDLEDGADKINADEAWISAMMAASGQKKEPLPPPPAAEEVEIDSQNMLRLLGLQPKERIELMPPVDVDDQ